MEKGTWVKEKIHGRIGYVTNPSGLRSCVQLVREPDGTKSTAIGWFSNTDLETLPQMDDAELHFLQILAVNTGDKEWFDELKTRRVILKNGGRNKS